MGGRMDAGHYMTTRTGLVLPHRHRHRNGLAATAAVNVSM